MLLLNPGATQTITLPPNGAPKGTQILFALRANQTLIVQAKTADTLITNGDAAAKSVTFATASHKIGALLLVMSIGSAWLAVNLSDCTMTVTP